jgi:hypothetical protein
MWVAAVEMSGVTPSAELEKRRRRCCDGLVGFRTVCGYTQAPPRALESHWVGIVCRDERMMQMDFGRTWPMRTVTRGKELRVWKRQPTRYYSLQMAEDR